MCEAVLCGEAQRAQVATMLVVVVDVVFIVAEIVFVEVDVIFVIYLEKLVCERFVNAT